jgi:hypothetical protein
MRSWKYRISRRSFLAGPAALVISGAAIRQPAHAFEAFAPNAIDLSKAALLSARHCAHHGFVDIKELARPFEADLLASDPSLLRSVALRAADIIGRESFDPGDFSKLERFTLPKPKHGALRIWGITEPQDAVTYLTLALLAAPLIEAHRVPTYRNVVHSWRFAPKRHRLFDDRFTLASFRTVTRERAESAEIVVSCDLTNCYGNLGADRVASALERCGVSTWQREYLRQLLSFWQSPDGLGLPIGPNASRILAEAVLLQIDTRLQDAGIDYIRFVDDFRLFAEDERSALFGLQTVADAAASQGLWLNANKTVFHRLTKANGPDTLQQGVKQRQFQRLTQNESNPNGNDQLLPRSKRSEIRMLRRLRNSPSVDALLQAEATSPISLKTLAETLRHAIYTQRADFLRGLPQLLEAYPEFATYAAATVQLSASVVTVDVRGHLRAEFARMLLAPATPDFVAVKLIEVLSHPDYLDRQTLEQFARLRSSNPRGMVFRTVLDALRATGGTAPNLVKRFGEMDGWAMRALLADSTLRQSIPISPPNQDIIATKLMV